MSWPWRLSSARIIADTSGGVYKITIGRSDFVMREMGATINARMGLNTWTGWRHRRAARRLQALFIDVNELADRVENAVKFTGDPWAARLVGLTAARVRLDGWRVNVQEKLRTLDAINRFAVDQAAAAQGQLLEAAIVLMMLVELGLFLR